MKISAFILSICGFCILYICNADWIDELIEDYLGSDYEEVAPFISSVTAGTEEFDQLVQELSLSKRKLWLPYFFILLTVACAFSLITLLHYPSYRMLRGRGVLKVVFQFLQNFRKSATDKEEIQNIVTEFLERKLKQLCGSKQSDDVPVKLLWKGNTLVESSIHCNLKEDSKFRNMQRQLLHSKVFFKSSDGGKGEKVMLAPSSSETSTARKMAEIRELLESELELEKFVDKGAGTDDKLEVGPSPKALSSSFSKNRRSSITECDISKERENDRRKLGERLRVFPQESFENKAVQKGQEEPESRLDSEWDGSPDQKLMNRIRLLESRLRLEELKNKNWINRMSRAEGILQQLNKQVERIEETRPMGTLTETLKITSTVTNWGLSSHPRRNMQFTLVDQYPPFCSQTPQMSLSELIKKEVGLPTPGDLSKNTFLLSPTPQVPALPSPSVMPQTSFLSKFLCR